MTTATDTRNRQERRHAEQTLPELMTKTQVAEFLQCSQRQVELLTQKKRICQPIYLGQSSPRWKRSELMAALEANQTEGGAN
jgi:predicted DNA-binding transcriptional regulator AlpA